MSDCCIELTIYQMSCYHFSPYYLNYLIPDDRFYYFGSRDDCLHYYSYYPDYCV